MQHDRKNRPREPQFSGLRDEIPPFSSCARFKFSTPHKFFWGFAKLNTAADWIARALTFIALFALAWLLGDFMGVPVVSEIDWDGDFEQRDSSVTAFGMAVIVICGMLAARAGMAISAKSLRGGLKPREELQFIGCLVGLLIFAVIAALIFRAARGVHNIAANLLFNALVIAFAAGIAWTVKKWYDHRIKWLRETKSENGEQL
jgi:hypothetical protein